LPSGPTTGSLCVLVATGEIFVHGWDLAKSTGQSTALAPQGHAKSHTGVIRCWPT